MAQSGHGGEPHPSEGRQAREGVVLPADGGAPLPPGTTGSPEGPGQSHGSHAAPPPMGTPPGGTPWGGPVPGQDPGHGQHPGQGQDLGHGQHPGQGQDLGHGQHPGQGYGYPQQEAGPGYGYPPQSAGSGYGYPPPVQHHQNEQPHQYQQPHQYPQPPQPSYGVDPGYQQQPQQQPQQPYPHESYPQQPYGAPVPAPADADATQFIAPIPSAPGGDADATQFIAPVPGMGGGPGPLPGALPPEHAAPPGGYPGQAPHQDQGYGAHAADADQQSTQYLPPVPPAPGKGLDPEAYEQGRTQPPAEFDSLFRTESPQAPGGSDAAGATQQLPFVPAPAPGQAPPPYAQGGPAQGGYGQGGYGQVPPGGPDAYGLDNGFVPPGRDDSRRSGSGGNGRNKGLIIGIAGVCVVALGLTAGALLSSGGDDDGKAKTSPVSATAPAGGQDGAKDSAKPSPSPSPDPAREQAVALDKLLGDSNNSRDAVVRSVGNIGGCKNLPQAAKDLRGAAKQRGDLVTRLAALPVDKLPQHQQLTDALNSAWKASATADNHYAGWADQTGRHGGCPKGRARSTPQRVSGDRASGEATTAKERAAGLWNAIAKQYGLTSRDKSRL